MSLALTGTTGSAVAQYAPGSIGNGGRMPETMSPGALAPPPTLPAPVVIPPVSSAPPPASSLGARYPNTESMARDRVRATGNGVERAERRNDGSYQVEVSPRPTTPVPKRIMIHPDGRMVEEW